LGAPIVNFRKPNGTGKHEIEAIKYEAEMALKHLGFDPTNCGFEDDLCIFTELPDTVPK
jgi:hypothetical protein